MAQNRRNRKWVYGSNTVISSIIFFAILVFVALIANRHPWRIDLTESGAFSLSEQTRNVLKAIDKPVTVKCFYAMASPDQAQAKAKIKDLLDTYKYYNSNINAEFVDPDVQPETARQYDVKTYGTLVLEGYDRKQVIPAPDEENITNALLKLSRKDQKKVYFLTGHGEHSFKADKDGYSNAKAALEKNYYAVAEFNLLQQENVPADASAVVIAGPMKPVAEHEQRALKAYLARGGKVMLMLDPLIDTGMEEFAKAYGIEVGNDVVIDRMSRLFGGSERIPVVVQYGAHKITNGFELPTFFPDARSVTASPKPPEGVQTLMLASTSPNAWGEMDLETLRRGQASYEEGKDLKAPVSLVAMANIAATGEKKDKEAETQPSAHKEHAGKNPGEGTLIVSGDSDFASNTYFGLYGNGDFFLNSINFLADEANLITVEPRQSKNKPMLLTQEQAKAVFWIVLVLVPLAVLVSGFTVYRIRRAQR